MLLSPRSFRMKVNGSFYPPSSSGVGTLPTRPGKPSPQRTRRSDTPTRATARVCDTHGLRFAAAGTVLGAGSHTLSVTFTPDDSANYGSVSASAQLSVDRATLTVTADDASRPYGVADPAF